MDYNFHVVLPAGLAIPFLIGYPIPALVAWRRRGPFRVPAIAVDLLLAWTFIGWVLALCLALARGDRTRGDSSQSVPWTVEYPARRR